MTKKLRAALARFFLTPSDGQALSALRIVVATAMLAEALTVWPFIEGLYGPFGYLQSHLLDFLTGATIPGIALRSGISATYYVTFLHGFYALHLAVLALFALGLGTPYVAILVWLTKTFLINSGNYSSYGVDSYFHNITFFLALFPSNRHWSLDRLLGRAGKGTPEESSTLGLRIIQLFLLMTYINAGVGKGMGAQWWSGEAIWESLNLPEFHHLGDFTWMAWYPLFPKLLGWGTVFAETFYFAGVWIPRYGRLWALAIAGMHLGIAAFMGMREFGFTLAAINVVLFLEPWKLPAWARERSWRFRVGPERSGNTPLRAL